MTSTSSIFEPEFVAQLALMFEQRISFNRLLVTTWTTCPNN